MSDSPTRISHDELFTPKVDEYLDTQAFLTRDAGAIEERSFLVKLFYSSWLYLAFWGTVGGVAAWAVLEPFIDDQAMAREDPNQLLAGLFLFPCVAACVGLFLGAAEGVMCRNAARAFTSGLIGLAVGFFGGLVALIPAVIVFGLGGILAAEVAGDVLPGEMPTGFALLVLMMARALAWALVAIPAGIGQGIAIKERKVILNGLLGAVLGGFIGGLAFDPISLVLLTDDGQAVYSRGVGIGIIGMVVGLFIGLIEGWTKTAWLLMKKGPLAGKQFILHKETSVLGSSPKAEVYLFKDDAIEPRHCIIHNRGGRFELEDCNTPDGAYVNGYPVKRAFLKSGDQIVLGKTVLEFVLRQSS